MIRITKMSGKYYGMNLTGDYEKDMDDITNFASQGTPVIIVDSLEDLESLDIYDEVTMIERD